MWGIHRDRWIPRTKGQLRGKCFHLVTSSWVAPHRWVVTTTVLTRASLWCLILNYGNNKEVDWLINKVTVFIAEEIAVWFYSSSLLNVYLFSGRAQYYPYMSPHISQMLFVAVAYGELEWYISHIYNISISISISISIFIAYVYRGGCWNAWT